MKYSLSDENEVISLETEYRPIPLMNIVSDGHHHWRFNISNYNDRSGCTFQVGIWKSNEPVRDYWLGYYPNTTYALSIKDTVINHATSSGSQQHGNIQCKTNDIIDIYLDLNLYELQFVVNAKKCGPVIKVDDTSYKAVAQIYRRDDALQFISYDFDSFEGK